MTRKGRFVVVGGIETRADLAGSEPISSQPRPNEDPPRATYVRDLGEVLADVAMATVELGDLRPLLKRLAGYTIEATGADRVSFFLFDEARRSLELWATVTSRRPAEGLWELGRSLPGITVDDVRLGLLELGEPIGIADAADSPLVPKDWLEAFRLSSLIVAPLRCGRDILGVLVVDYRERRDLPQETIRIAGTIAASSAMAVGNAGLVEALAEHGASLERLLEIGRALTSPRSLEEVAEKVADAIVDVLGARLLSVHVLDETGRAYRTLAQRGISLPEAGDLSTLPRWSVARVALRWRRERVPKPIVLDDVGGDARAAFDIPDHLGSTLVLPLVRPTGEVFGFVLVGCHRAQRPTADMIDLAAGLAAHVAFAVDRAQLDERVAVGAEFSRALLAIEDLEDVRPEGLVDALHRAVPPALGFQVVDVAVDWLRPTEGTAGGWRPRSGFEARVRRNWRRRRTRPDTVEHDGEAYTPVWAAGRVAGVVRSRPLRPPLAPHHRDLLDALAGSLGEVLERRLLREEAARREREAALAEERALAAAELHGAISHLLATIAESAERPLSEPTRSRHIAALARTGLTTLTQAAGEISTMRPSPVGFETTLTNVVARLGEELGAAADLCVRGDPRRLPTEVEQTLVRVVYESLARIGAHGRSSAVAVRLEFGDGEIELVVRDDGAGLPNREEGGVFPSTHFGLRTIQRRIAELGGDFTVESCEPRGVRMRARIPA